VVGIVPAMLHMAFGPFSKSSQATALPAYAQPHGVDASDASSASEAPASAGKVFPLKTVHDIASAAKRATQLGDGMA
jgi:hypothetical protein